jgi:hypothetical protein
MNKPMKIKFLLLVVVTFMVLGQTTAVFAASRTITANLSGANQRGCRQAGEWHFVINQVNPPTPPASITVAWDNAYTLVVPLNKVSGGVAHYTTGAYLAYTVTSATAVIDDSWGGNFNLSCSAPTAVVVESFSAASPGQDVLQGVGLFLIGISILAAIAVCVRAKVRGGA